MFSWPFLEIFAGRAIAYQTAEKLDESQTKFGVGL